MNLINSDEFCKDADVPPVWVVVRLRAILRIELSPKNASWVLVTDARFFKDGESER
jgi:hypothetical protein